MILTPDGVCICTCEGEPTSLILPSSMSTAAGESTLPVRGSSSRPAFTSVSPAGDWAASSRVESNPQTNTANGKNILICLIGATLLWQAKTAVSWQLCQRGQTGLPGKRRQGCC